MGLVDPVADAGGDGQDEEEEEDGAKDGAELPTLV
jgi:hypothetical protein